jgi:hypothetical protein
MANGSCAYCGEPVPRKHSKYCSQACVGLDQKRAVKVTCPCGAEFETTASRIAGGRGKFCSRACKLAYATRRSGLTYNIVKVNPTWIKPGQEPWNKGLRGTHFSPETEFRPGEHPSPETEFKPGQPSWNKGTVGVMPSGADHPHWRGDEVGCQGLHERVYRERGPASSHVCQHADDTCSGPIDWANVSHEYRDTQDFMPLCRSHHIRYDKKFGWGSAKPYYGR